MAVQKCDGVDALQEHARRDGWAASTVRDGHVLVLQRERFRQLLDSMPPDQEFLTVFLKRAVAN